MVGMGDMMGMMKKAKQMQKDMENLQKTLAKEESSTTIADMVTITISGKGNITKIELTDEAMADKETLEDLIMAAFNEGKEKMDKHAEKEMQKITGGMNLPF